jgi:uncharacterized protein with von Willebrand factor type A (vWA) domain
LTRHYPDFVWINPQPYAHWRHTPSITLVREILEDRMYPLTLAGLEEAIEALS